MAEYLTPPPAKLTSESTQSKTDAQLQEIILKGRPGTAMVGFEGALNATQMAGLLAYLRSLKPYIPHLQEHWECFGGNGNYGIEA